MEPDLDQIKTEWAPLVVALKRARIERDVTYEAMAEQVGVSVPTVYRTLCYHSLPTERAQYKFEKWLKAVPADALMR